MGHYQPVYYIFLRDMNQGPQLRNMKNYFNFKNCIFYIMEFIKIFQCLLVARKCFNFIKPLGAYWEFPGIPVGQSVPVCVLYYFNERMYRITSKPRTIFNLIK